MPSLSRPLQHGVRPDIVYADSNDIELFNCCVIGKFIQEIKEPNGLETEFILNDGSRIVIYGCENDLGFYWRFS